MDTFIGVMAFGALGGLVVLGLIASELARRNKISPAGSVLLAIGLGLGVLSATGKALSFAYIERALPALRVKAAPPPRGDGQPSKFRQESSITAPWVALEPNSSRSNMALVGLGERLFFDKTLSADGTIACASCHRSDRGGSDGRRVSIGVKGLAGTRNAPSVLDAALLSRQFWDGRADTLEAQAHGPVLNPVEMAMPNNSAVGAALAAKPFYARQFPAVFGATATPTLDYAAIAIAAYEKTLVMPSRYDRFVRGDLTALDRLERRGMALFAGLGCRECHRDPSFSAAGLIQPAGVMKPFPLFADNPLVKLYRLNTDKGAAAPLARTGLWRPPSLRNVARTSPYFHNGAVKDLRMAVRIMVEVQLGRRTTTAPSVPAQNTHWNARTRRIVPLRPTHVTQEDVDALVAFLRSLQSDDGEKKEPADPPQPVVAATFRS